MATGDGDGDPASIDFTARIDLPSAGDFLDALTPHRGKELWSGPPRRTWMFRGHADADWGLRPSVQRPDALAPFLHGLDAISEPGTLRSRRAVELELVAMFASHAAQQGHDVPGDTPHLRDLDNDTTAWSESKAFPPVSMRGMFCLAQHFGIPTRFLDWTLSPLVAAYFAASDAVQRVPLSNERQEGRRLAVWALNDTFVGEVCSKWNPGIVFVTAPPSSNPNLRAQRGLFTLVRYAETPDPDADIPAVDDLLRAPPNSYAVPWLYRRQKQLYEFTLPYSEAEELLGILERQDVNVMTVFPNLDSIAEHMRDRWRRK